MTALERQLRQITSKSGWMLASLAMLGATSAQGQKVALTSTAPAGLKRLPMSVTGRVDRKAGGSLLRQWPGTYFETAFAGSSASFRVGLGEVGLRVTVDNRMPVRLVKPAPGIYRVSGLAPGRHRLRVDVASESQASPTSFGGFFAPARTKPAPLIHRVRAIEFIGDSHTVGYGNTSSTRQCTEDQVWAATDTSRGLAPLVASHYNADYQVNAISGRGIVRNYNGFAAATLPEAYPYAMFDKAKTTRDSSWHPQVIAIALGTNDFSTPLNPGEKWTSRDALRADFESSYVRFVQQLRARNPRAYVLLWATDLGDGEIKQEVSNVAERLHQAGDARVGFVTVRNLSMSACNFHPSIADDELIARTLVDYINKVSGVWPPDQLHAVKDTPGVAGR